MTLAQTLSELKHQLMQLDSLLSSKVKQEIAARFARWQGFAAPSARRSIKSLTIVTRPGQPPRPLSSRYFVVTNAEDHGR